jgi:hypothetical protein
VIGLCSEGSLALPILSLDRLLIEIGVVMMMVYDHHNLALCSIGHAR